MPKFSARSMARLQSCHPDLIRLFAEVIRHVDCTILEGHRTLERQKELYAEGKTKTLKSKHLSDPSMAIDVAPHPIDWGDRERFTYFAGFVMGTAKSMGIDLTWGGDWNGNFDLADNSFDDLVHFELI